MIFIAAASVAAANARQNRPVPGPSGPAREIYWKIGEEQREFDSLQGAVYQDNLRIPSGQRLKVAQYEDVPGFSLTRAARQGLGGAASLLAAMIPGGVGAGVGKSLHDFAQRQGERGSLIREGEIFVGPAPQDPDRQAVLYQETSGPVPSHREHAPAFIAFSRYGAGF